MKRTLQTMLTANDEAETANKWGDVCKSRMEECIVHDKPLLQFAEKLQREKEMYVWGVTWQRGNDEKRTQNRVRRMAGILLKLPESRCME